MKVKGTHRFVFLVGSVVVKIPRVRVGMMLKDIFSGNLLRIYKYARGAFWHIFKYSYLEGLLENLEEIRCCFSNRQHPIVVPVLVPLGVVNLYPRLRSEARVDMNLVSAKIEESGDKNFKAYWANCSHTFEHPENFAVIGDRVRVLDYGERGFADLIRLYGDKLQTILNSCIMK